MKLDHIKHNIKWNSYLGDKYRSLSTWLGLKLLKSGRILIKRGGDRCSWCGERPGFSSTISKKGLRCSSLNRNCSDMP